MSHPTPEILGWLIVIPAPDAQQDGLVPYRQIATGRGLMTEDMAEVLCRVLAPGDGIVAAVCRLNRVTITTPEQLAAVPNGTILQTRAGTIASRLDTHTGLNLANGRKFAWGWIGTDAEIIWAPTSATPLATTEENEA